jgi:multiple sugar transport system permease protein
VASKGARAGLTSTAQAAVPVATRARPRWGEAVLGYLFILPLLAIFGAFVLYPVAVAIRYAFSRYLFLTGAPPRFDGLTNFRRWFDDPRVLDSLGITLKYTAIYVPVSTLYALVVAILLDRVISRRIATFYRVLLYLPVVLPASVIFHMWKWMYDPTWGMFNQLLSYVGVSPLRWLSDPELALPSIAMAEVWHLMGVTMMLFLVGLNNIPHELNEAAMVDGASPWQVTRHVTLPLLRPIFFIVLVLRLQTLGVVIPPLIMTNGGPIKATTTYGLQAYFIAFRDMNWNIGYASTWFLMLALFSTVIAFTGWYFMRERMGG